VPAIFQKKLNRRKTRHVVQHAMRSEPDTPAVVPPIGHRGERANPVERNRTADQAHPEADQQSAVIDFDRQPSKERHDERNDGESAP
jgi:hypothetical protein